MVERKRHLAKAVSYRVFGSLATAGIAYAISGRTDVAAGVGIADTFVKIGLYYLHERLWYRIRWGVKTSAPSASAGHIEAQVLSEAKPEARGGSHAGRPGGCDEDLVRAGGRGLSVPVAR